MNGHKFINDYKRELALFFDQGIRNSSRKMNSGQMCEALKIKYPNRLTIPSETEIRQEIGALFNNSKQKKRGATQKKHTN